MTRCDLTPRASKLDQLRPPPLDAVPELTADFRIPDDPLAGIVSGRTKTFTQTVRATHDGVERIPPIPFAYFDPTTEAYQTAWTDPIDLTVAPASELALSQIVGAPGASGPTRTALTEMSTGILANYTNPDRLLASTATGPRWWTAAVLAAPPLAFFTVTLSHRVNRRRRLDPSLDRRRHARRVALQRLAEASNATATERAEAIAAALRGYVSDRCALPSGGLTRAEVDTQLRQAVDQTLADRVDSILARCEQCCYAGGTGEDLGGLSGTAAAVINELERSRLR